MRIQTRQRIFYAFLLLFCVVGAFVVLYADGWRIDPHTFQAQKAGGIYVRSYPSDAAITLNDEPVQNQSGFLSPGTFIAGLFPKTYTIKLTAPGYDAWLEKPVVVPTLVTEMKYSVLIPQKPTDTVATGTVTAFYEVDGDPVTRDASGSILWRGATIGHGTIVSHSTDLKTLILRATSTRSTGVTYTLYDFANGTSTNLSAILQADGITPAANLNVFIDPYDDTTIFVQTRTAIIRVDAETHRASAIEAPPAGTTVESPLAISASVMAWGRSLPGASSTEIMVFDKFSGDMIDSHLVVPGIVKQLAWIRTNQLGILQEDGELFVYNVPNETLSKLADDATQCYPSPDGNSIAVLEHHAIEVFVMNVQEYHRFVPPQIATIQGLVWYRDSAHFFVQYPDRVALLDLADAGLNNLTTVSAGTMSSYDAKSNALYIIDNSGTLVRYVFPQ